jgi:hypothetical protein
MYMKTGKILTAIFIFGLLFFITAAAQDVSRPRWSGSMTIGNLTAIPEDDSPAPQVNSPAPQANPPVPQVNYPVQQVNPPVPQVNYPVQQANSAPNNSRPGWTKENLQAMYMEHLRAEGYLPMIDDSDDRGDIIFKVSGENYYIMLNADDLQFFQIYKGVSLGPIEAEAAINAANYSNRHSKVAKVWISSDGKSVSINTELLLDNPQDFANVFSRALAVIRNAEKNFFSQIQPL